MPKLIQTSSTSKSTFGWLLCSYCCNLPPPPPAAFVWLFIRMLIRLVVVSLFHLQRPLQFTRIIEFLPFLFYYSCWLLYLLRCYLPMLIPLCIPIIVVSSCVFLWASLASIFPVWGNLSVQAIVGSLMLNIGGGVCICDRYAGWITAADTTASITRGICDDVGWVWWQLDRYFETSSHGLGGGDCDLSVENDEKRRKSQKMSNSAPILFKTTTGDQGNCDSLVKVRWQSNSAALWLSNTAFTFT